MRKVLAISMIVSMLMIGCKSEPEVAFDKFLNNQHKKSFLVLPLCSAGESVVPIVTQKIKNKNMERRTYAIGFLGTTESKVPLPVLKAILEDESEKIGYRANSLKSVYLIDEETGKNLALKYKNQDDYIGKTANEIIRVENHSDYKKERKKMICSPND